MGVILKESDEKNPYLGWLPIMEDLESGTDGLNLICCYREIFVYVVREGNLEVIGLNVCLPRICRLKPQSPKRHLEQGAFGRS